MSRARRVTAVLCIVALIAGAWLPGFGAVVGCAILVALWFVLPPAPSAGRAGAAPEALEQPVSLLALLPARAPPLPALS